MMKSRHRNPKYVLLKGNDVLGDSLAPVIITPNIRTETGEYITPESGNIILKVISKPGGSFSRLDSGLYTLEAIKKIVKWDGNPEEYTQNMGKLYSPLINRSILQLMGNTRVFGISTVRGLSDFQKDVPTVNAPVILGGRLELDYGPPRDSALKILRDEFIPGEDPMEWQDYVRMEVFLIICKNFEFRVLLTRYYDIRTWLSSPAGLRFLNLRYNYGEKNYGFAKLGYHYDNSPNKRVVEVGVNGDRFLQKFIFKPGEWNHFDAINQFSIPIRVLEGGVDGEVFKSDMFVDRVKKDALDLSKEPWYSQNLIDQTFFPNDKDDDDDDA